MKASFPKCVRSFLEDGKNEVCRDDLGTDEIGTDGLVKLRLVKPSCASLEVSLSVLVWHSGRSLIPGSRKG